MSSSDTTPFGLWRYGNDFRLAANTIMSHHNKPAFMPYFSTIGHSIELFLKAFLLAKGVPLSVLKRRDYGHNLSNLVDLALENKITEHVDLNSAQVAVIRAMSEEYESKRYQYIRTGIMFLPDISIIHEAAEKLSMGLKRLCYDATDWSKEK